MADIPIDDDDIDDDDQIGDEKTDLEGTELGLNQDGSLRDSVSVDSQKEIDGNSIGRGDVVDIGERDNIQANRVEGDDISKGNVPTHEESSRSSVSQLLQYPHNLLFAQNMLGMAMTQMHQWENYYMQLQLAHQKMSAIPIGVHTASIPGMPKETLAAPVTEREVPLAEPGAPVEPQPQVPAVNVAQVGVMAGVPEENIWQRFRLGSIIKVALIMILLEVKPVWFFVYFFAVFLYLGGIFEPIIEWFNRNTGQQPLEMQLRLLRDREERAANPPPPPAPPAEGEEAADGAEAERQVDQPVEQEVGPPPYVVRFLYQLLVMFFMTLLPMWNPNPVYLT